LLDARLLLLRASPSPPPSPIPLCGLILKFVRVAIVQNLSVRFEIEIGFNEKLIRN
jgi:hypothetical protein